jgi:hypothetical protein
VLSQTDNVVIFRGLCQVLRRSSFVEDGAVIRRLGGEDGTGGRLRVEMWRNKAGGGVCWQCPSLVPFLPVTNDRYLEGAHDLSRHSASSPAAEHFIVSLHVVVRRR